jgi:hypothetical protein
MNIKIIAVTQTSDHPETIVHFSTTYGIGRGKWTGPWPKVGSNYEVEVEVENELTWGKNALETDSSEPRIDYDRGKLQIRGILEVAEPDGYTAIRLGDSLITFTAFGSPPAIGTYISICIERVTLYDTGV